MDGGSLANVLNQVGPIPERVLASIAYQILWGLAYLKHEKRVHRDMKPSNLLINSLGEVKVCVPSISCLVAHIILKSVGSSKRHSTALTNPYRYISIILKNFLVVLNPNNILF